MLVATYPINYFSLFGLIRKFDSSLEQIYVFENKRGKIITVWINIPSVFLLVYMSDLLTGAFLKLGRYAFPNNTCHTHTVNTTNKYVRELRQYKDRSQSDEGFEIALDFLEPIYLSHQVIASCERPGLLIVKKVTQTQ